MAIPSHLLEILACPACEERPPLKERGNYLVCEACQRAYPIRDGIPILLVDESLPLEQVQQDEPTENAR
ncbi:MAG: Trm112 family protein [Fimbriimonadales bacterium]